MMVPNLSPLRVVTPLSVVFPFLLAGAPNPIGSSFPWPVMNTSDSVSGGACVKYVDAAECAVVYDRFSRSLPDGHDSCKKCEEYLR